MNKLWKKIICFVLPVVMVAIVCMAVVLPLANKSKTTKTTTDTTLLAREPIYYASAEDTGASTASSSEKGGAIYVGVDSTYTMKGGTISGKSKKYGGAVYVSNGATFTMEGGTITSCTARYGGAIYVASGATCNITGGSITGNSATYAPAIYVEDGGVLNIKNDALISNNEYINGYTLTLIALVPDVYDNENVQTIKNVTEIPRNYTDLFPYKILGTCICTGIFYDDTFDQRAYPGTPLTNDLTLYLGVALVGDFSIEIVDSQNDVYNYDLVERYLYNQNDIEKISDLMEIAFTEGSVTNQGNIVDPEDYYTYFDIINLFYFPDYIPDTDFGNFVEMRFKHPLLQDVEIDQFYIVFCNEEEGVWEFADVEADNYDPETGELSLSIIKNNFTLDNLSFYCVILGN